MNDESRPAKTTAVLLIVDDELAVCEMLTEFICGNAALSCEVPG